MLCVGRCPKLTRYKVMTSVLMLSCVTLLTLSSYFRFPAGHAWDTPPFFTFYSIALFASNRSDDVHAAPDHLHKCVFESQVNITGNGSDTRRHRSLQKRFPAAIVIGARKAGTRALLRFINLHPDVKTSKHEIHFFDRFYSLGSTWYLNQMPSSAPGQITLEKTPSYFVDAEVPARVFRFNSSIKLVLIVRNPIDRALSDYLQLKDKSEKSGVAGYFGSFQELAFNSETGTINRSYAPIRRSIYSRHLEKWLVYFRLSQMLVIDGDKFRAAPWEIVHQLEQFLGLSHLIGRERFVYNLTKGFYCIKQGTKRRPPESSRLTTEELPAWTEQCLADSKGRNHPILSSGLRQQLLTFFAPFNMKFFDKIGQEFNWT